MTTPKVNTIHRGGSRFYVHPETAEKVPGVTSVLNMLPKPFLKNWAAKMVAEAAVENIGEVVTISARDKAAAIDFLKRAPERFTRGAADIGTDVHDLFDRIAKGETLGRVHPDLKPYVDHFNEFIEEFSPEFIFTEETVWSDAHLYAGSFDAYMIVAGERIWADWKTTRSGVHAEVGLQLAAYRHADYILRSDGSRVPMPEADGGAVLHVRPEGWSLVPVRCDEEVFEDFLTLRKVFDFERSRKSTLVGKPINAKPLKGSVGR